MAETAEILRSANKKVILPDLTAGYSMAEMAQTDVVTDYRNGITPIVEETSITPITYMNCTTDIKSLCGQNGGIASSSSNVDKSFQ